MSSETGNTIVKNVILSYPYLFEPRKEEKDNGKIVETYQAVFVFDEESEGLNDLKRAVIELAKSEYGDKAAVMIRDQELHSPFRTDKVIAKGYPEGSTYVTAKTFRMPAVVGTWPDPSDPTKVCRITEEQADDSARPLVYPGVRVNASLRPYTWFHKDHKRRGISINLNGVQVVNFQAPRIDSVVPAEDEFEVDPSTANLPMPGEDSAPAPASQASSEDDELEGIL